MASDHDHTNKDDSKAGLNGHVPEAENPKDGKVTPSEANVTTTRPSDVDDFGLPIKTSRTRRYSDIEEESTQKEDDEKQRNAETVVNGEAESETPSTPNTDQSQKVDNETDEKAKPEHPISPTASTSGSGVHGTPSRRLSRHTAQKASIGGTSEWSHQQLAPQADLEEKSEDEGEWQAMPALATHRIYDDWGKVLAKEYDEVEEEKFTYGNLGGAGKGYTRVQVDDDAQSATSLDETTAYLFKGTQANSNTLEDEEDARDIVSQMQTTKDLLTEGQRVAYVGLVRLSIVQMVADLERLERTKSVKKFLELAVENMRMLGQKIMLQLYTHMDISPQEQVMVEQLAEHGVIPTDLTPTLMQNARVKNPQAELSVNTPPLSSTNLNDEKRSSSTNLSGASTPAYEAPPPAYQDIDADELALRDPDELAGAKNIDLDLRWSVLCDLFLLLVTGGVYDARARVLLERVGSALSVDWQEICRFEKRVTDALEMQEQANKENWNEDEHLKAREKSARTRRLMVMGLCTVGGGLIIGLSAGMLAPVIGAGLAAGFTGIGVAGTGTFLGGTGAAALIGTTGSLIGSSIGMRTSNRRTGAVKTFEYRPLFNNKRVNLIVTVAGWMTGKVDDVRLPFSTVSPIMGDIYSVNWEPEMLQSTGETIQILGTEALTQTIQQILGATFLATLMAGLSLPLVLSKLSYLIDNPWTVSLARADASGLILADSLIDRNLGVRPITLVGFSLGSRVIFSCLRELAKRGALGIIQDVYMFGSPVVVKKDEWLRVRGVVSGRFVNGYATNDWILAYLFRATAGGLMRVAGLATVDIPGIENVNVTEEVPGHMAYRGMMPTLLHNVGWQVESVEFTEIEDPDPDNHEKRQRELINEIEEARQQLEEERTKKKGFSAFFSRRKAVRSQKKGWETYDERSTRVIDGNDMEESERVASENSNVMFDVDAIRREALQLALEGTDIEEIKQHMQIREIQTTLPALRLSMSPSSLAANGEDRRASSSLPLNGAKSSEDLSPSRLPTRSVSLAASNTSLPLASTENAPERPGLNRNAVTSPDLSADGETSLEKSHGTPVKTEKAKNPWGDDEDAEFGQEGDISMSFE